MKQLVTKLLLLINCMDAVEKEQECCIDLKFPQGKGKEEIWEKAPQLDGKLDKICTELACLKVGMGGEIVKINDNLYHSPEDIDSGGSRQSQNYWTLV